MKDSERLFELINEISDEKEVGMFDATLIFCENNNIEIEDIIPIFDDYMLEKIKGDALDMNIVCNKKLFARKTTSLF